MQPDSLTDVVLSLPSRMMRKGIEEQLRKEAPHLDPKTMWNSVRVRAESSNADPAHALLAGLLEPYATRHGGDGQTIIFWPEDFVSYFLDLAEASGIDVEEFGRKLDPASEHPEYVVGFAFRALCEIEDLYVEVPGACIGCRIPRAFLITVAAAMIGIATNKLGTNNAYLTGTLSGIGSLLLNILANRYSSAAHSQTDWLEELILRTIEGDGRQTARELHERTHIESRLLEKTLHRLLDKKLLMEIPHWSGNHETEFDLSQR
jgi:hypothetical protein